jgi:hypothetical protein
VFSSSTDHGSSVGLSIAPACELVLDAATADASGSPAVCQWLSPTELEVSFGDDASLVPGDLVSVKPGVLRNVDGSSPLAAVNLLTALLAFRSLPVVGLVLNAPTIVGSCTDIIADVASSSFGRSATAAWILRQPQSGGARSSVADST